MPVIVCLTYADRLYAEYIHEDPQPTDEIKRKIGADLDVSERLFVVGVD